MNQLLRRSSLISGVGASATACGHTVLSIIGCLDYLKFFCIDSATEEVYVVDSSTCLNIQSVNLSVLESEDDCFPIEFSVNRHVSNELPVNEIYETARKADDVFEHVHNPKISIYLIIRIIGFVSNYIVSFFPQIYFIPSFRFCFTNAFCR